MTRSIRRLQTLKIDRFGTKAEGASDHGGGVIASAALEEGDSSAAAPTELYAHPLQPQLASPLSCENLLSDTANSDSPVSPTPTHSDMLLAAVFDSLPPLPSSPALKPTKRSGPAAARLPRQRPLRSKAKQTDAPHTLQPRRAADAAIDQDPLSRTSLATTTSCRGQPLWRLRWRYSNARSAYSDCHRSSSRSSSGVPWPRGAADTARTASVAATGSKELPAPPPLRLNDEPVMRPTVTVQPGRLLWRHCKVKM